MPRGSLEVAACPRPVGQSFWLLALTLAVWAPSSTLWAHGTPPTVLGVVTADSQGPTLLRLSAGLAVRDPIQPKKFKYVCSPRWVAPKSPLVTRTGQSSAWLTAEEGVFRVDAAGKVNRAAVQGLDPLTIRALGAAGSEALALVVSKGAAKVVALSRPPVAGSAPSVWTGSGEWHGARNSADAMWIVQSAGAVVRLVGVRADGQATQEDVAADTSTATASLAWVSPTADKLYLSLIGKALQRIYEVDRSAPYTGPRAAKLLLQDFPFVAGPVALGNRAVAVQVGVLVDIAPIVTVTLDDSRWYTCVDGVTLADGTAAAFACARGELHALNASGKPAGQAFALHQLTPPDYTGFDDISRFACWAEWGDLARDAGLDPGAEPPGTVAPADGGSCTVAGLGSPASAESRLGGYAALLAAALLAWVGSRR
ncbi:MAG: hypothetical protein EXR77_11360 [Myxococcales bacterium]|nr:hypothetical protein [Myxococcales bacterium]